MPAGSSEHLTIPDVEDAVFQPGAEIGGRNVLRVGVIEVVQHQTKVSGLVDGFDRSARPAAERSGKLLAEIGRASCRERVYGFTVHKFVCEDVESVVVEW